jgi:hypothetical protein
VNRVFWATCPKCLKAFVVSWELRHASVHLVCPFCTNRFLPDEAVALDERF